jgi:hypothetical protein
MNTTIAAIEEDINGRRRATWSFGQRMGVSMNNFVQQGDMVTVTASAGGVTSGDLIVAPTSPVLYPIGTAMKETGTLAAMVRMRFDGVAVVAAGA